MVYKFLKVLLYGIFRVLFRLDIKGEEHIPLRGATVIASNHISLLDPPVLGVAATRKVHFMAKKELFVPVLGSFYRYLGAFPVQRGGADRVAIKHGLELLRGGHCLAIFPEGTRSKTGLLGKAEPGALLMAGKTNACIVPACVLGTDLIRSGRLWPKVKVRFGPPLYFPQGGLTKEILREHTDALMERIAALQKEARDEG